MPPESNPPDSHRPESNRPESGRAESSRSPSQRPRDRRAPALRLVGADPRELVLVKKGQRFVFRCEPGRERDLLDKLVEMVQDPDCALDWFDAAVLSHQLGQAMHQQLDALRRKSA